MRQERTRVPNLHGEHGDHRDQWNKDQWKDASYASVQQTRRQVLCFAMGAISLASARVRATDALKEDGFKGIRAPDWQLRALDGQTHRLSSFKGKAVVLNFWATWCAPCRVKTKWLGEIHKEFRPRGLEVLGVSMDEPTDDALVAEFAKKYAVNYPLLRDASIAAD